MEGFNRRHYHLTSERLLTEVWVKLLLNRDAVAVTIKIMTPQLWPFHRNFVSSTKKTVKSDNTTLFFFTTRAPAREK